MPPISIRLQHLFLCGRQINHAIDFGHTVCREAAFTEFRGQFT
jgi:hypothetical protein